MTDAYLKYLQNKSLGLSPAPEQKKQYKIPMKSLKRKVEQKLYVKQVKEMLEENPYCEIKAPGCTGIAEGLDHLQKRSPKNYRKRNNLVRACNNCNRFKELFPEHPISKKFTISKFKP